MNKITQEYYIHELGRTLSLDFVAEYKFHPKRKWRFDFACIEKKIAIEFEGINYNGTSRHRTGTGYINDMEKYNSAVSMGWHLFRCTEQMYSNNINVYWESVFNQIQEFLNTKTTI